MDYKISLKAARVNANMTQAEAARRLKISDSTIRSWECGDTSPRAGMISMICEVYGIPPELLFIA